MITGDLVRFKRLLAGDSRRMGTVLAFDLYHGGRLEGGTFRYQTPEKLVRVLWNHGGVGWVSRSRLEVIDGDV